MPLEEQRRLLVTPLRKGGRAFPSRPLPHIASFPLEFLLKVRNSGCVSCLFPCPAPAGATDKVS